MSSRGMILNTFHGPSARPDLLPEPPAPADILPEPPAPVAQMLSTPFKVSMCMHYSMLLHKVIVKLQVIMTGCAFCCVDMNPIPFLLNTTVF